MSLDHRLIIFRTIEAQVFYKKNDSLRFQAINIYDYNIVIDIV